MDQHPHTIEIRLQSVDQLFNSLDPSPFLEKELDKEADEFITGWARELPRKAPIGIVVHLPESAPDTVRASALAQVPSEHFAYRADVAARERRELLRVGTIALGIGTVVLAGCLTASHMAELHFSPGPLRRILTESLLLLGWVANWLPIETFLYGWVPYARRERLYRRLARADVRVVRRGTGHGDSGA